MFDSYCPELVLAPSSGKYKGAALDIRASRACMIADTLSWAVLHNMPFQQALTTLPFYQKWSSVRSRTLVTLRHIIRFPFVILRLPWLKNWPLSLRIQRVIDDLNNGKRLSSSLQKHMGRVFPDFYVLGVGKAEAEGRLHIALPILARQMNYPCSVANEQHIQLVLIAYKLLALGFMMSLLLTKIIPNFILIFDEISSTAPIASDSALVTIGGIVSKSVLGIGVFLLFLPRFNFLCQSLVFHVPIAGPTLKRFVVADVAHAMATFIRQGDDIVTAAEWSVKSTRSRWMKNRLQQFVEKVKAGHKWDDAWCELKLGRPLDEWVIRNAAARQDPASGFELLAEWHHQEIARTARLIETWLDPICTLVIAVLVGFVASGLFSMYSQLLRILL